MQETEITIASYNLTAEEYAEKTRGLHLEKEISKFLSCIKKGGLILDIGCGAGRDASIFTGKKYQVIGIDPAEKLIEIARQTVPLARFEIAYAENPPFQNETFDGVWACASLIHLPKKDLPKTLSEIYRVLKPNGIFASSFKQGEGEALTEDKRYNNVQKFFSYYQQSEIEKLLENSEFNVFDIWDKKINNSYATNTWMNFFCKK